MPPGQAAPLLLVDDDGGAPRWRALLNAIRPGRYDALAAPVRASTLRGYPVVLWETGDTRLPALTPEEKGELSAYLDGGGVLLLSSRWLLDGEYFTEIDVMTGRVKLDAFARRLGVRPPLPPQAATTLAWGPLSLALKNHSLSMADREPFYLAQATGTATATVVDASGAYPGAALGVASPRLHFWTFGPEHLDSGYGSAPSDEALLRRALAALEAEPALLWSLPVDGAAGVPPNASVTLAFRADVDTSAVTAALSLSAGAAAVPFTWAYDAAARRLTVTPAALAPSTDHELGYGAARVRFRTGSAASMTAPAAPGAPALSVAATHDGQIVLDLPPAAPGTFLRVQRRRVGQTAWTTLGGPIDAPVPDDVHFEYALVAVDAAGNESPRGPSLIAVSRDRTAPVLAVVAPVSGSRTNADSLDVRGSVDDSTALVSVNGQPAASAGTAWTKAGLALSFGDNELVVEARDAAGNLSRQVLAVERDTTTLAPEGLAVMPSTPTGMRLQWEASGETDLVETQVERRSGGVLASWSPLGAVPAPDLSFVDASAAAGSGCYRLRTRDDLGNVGPYSRELCPGSGGAGGGGGLQGGSFGAGGSSGDSLSGTSLTAPEKIKEFLGPARVRYLPLTDLEVEGPEARLYYSSTNHHNETTFYELTLDNPQGFQAPLTISVEVPEGFWFSTYTYTRVHPFSHWVLYPDLFLTVHGNYTNEYAGYQRAAPPAWDLTQSYDNVFRTHGSPPPIHYEPRKMTFTLSLQSLTPPPPPVPQPVPPPPPPNQVLVKAIRFGRDVRAYADPARMAGPAPRAKITVNGTVLEGGLPIPIAPAQQGAANVIDADEEGGLLDLAGGDYSFEVPLFRGAGAGLNVEGLLRYSSRLAKWHLHSLAQAKPELYGPRPLGVGWAYPYGLRLIPLDEKQWQAGVPTLDTRRFRFVGSDGRVADFGRAYGSITLEGRTYDPHYLGDLRREGFDGAVLVQDGQDWVIRERNPALHGYAQLRFDAQKRLKAIVPHGGGRPVSIEYTGAGQVVTDASGRRTTFVLDADGRIQRIEDPSGGVWTLGYSGEALVSIQAASSYQWGFAYDAASHLLTERRRPDGLTLKTAYDTDPAPPNGFRWGSLSATFWAGEPARSLRRFSYALEGAPRRAPFYYAGRDRVTVTGPSGRNTELYDFEADLLNGPNVVVSDLDELTGAERYRSYEQSGPHGDHNSADFFGSTTSVFMEGSAVRSVVTMGGGWTKGWSVSGFYPGGSWPISAGTVHAPVVLYDSGRQVFYDYADAGGPKERRIAEYPPGHEPWSADPRRVEYEYEPQFYRIVKSSDPFGFKTLFDYHQDPKAGLVRRESRCVGAEYLHTTTSTYPHSWLRDYDGLGRLTAVTDPAGFTMRYGYDAVGRLSWIAGPSHASGSTATARADYEYDGDLLAKVTWTEPGGRISQEAYAYDTRGRLTERREPSGAWRYEHDDDGNLTAQVSPGGARTTYEYDNRGNLLRETGAENEVTELDYDEADRVKEARRIDGARRRVWTIRERDRAGRVKDVELPEVFQDGVTGRPRLRTKFGWTNELVEEHYSFNGSSETIGYQYGPSREVTRVNVAMGNGEDAYITYDRDPAGRLRRAWGLRLNRIGGTGVGAVIVRQPGRSQPSFTAYTHSCFDTVESLRDRSGDERLRTASDPGGLASEVRVPRPSRMHVQGGAAAADTAGARLTLDAAGLATRVEDSLGRARELEFDAGGDLVHAVDPSSAAYSLERGEGGVLRSLGAGALSRALTRLRPDGEGRPRHVDAPGDDGPGTSLEYDKAGRLVDETDPRGGVTHRDYDKFGELQRLVYADRSKVEYERDGLGRLSVSREYDAAGALQRTERREYDNLGRLFALEDEKYRIVTRKDALGRLVRKETTLKDLGLTKTQSHTWGEFGNLMKAVDDDGETTDYAWDDEDNLLRVTKRMPSGLVLSAELVHDKVGKLSSWSYSASSAAPLSASLERDDRGRLTRLSYVSASTQPTRPLLDVEYGYDSRDLRVSAVHHHRGLRVDYGHDAQGFLTSETWRDLGSGETVRRESISYDAAGNRVAREVDGRRTTYGYDQGFQLVTEDAREVSCLSSGVSVTADSTRGAGYEASLAVDGRGPDDAGLGQGWSSDGTDADHWLELDLGAPRPIPGVQVAFPTERGPVEAFRFEVWDAVAAQFRPVVPATVFAGARRGADSVRTAGHTVALGFGAPILAQRVRVLVARGGARRDAFINEVCLLQEDAGVKTRQYDAVGRLVSDGRFTYGYDVHGRLTSARGPGVDLSWTITPEGVRGSETDHRTGRVTYFLHNGADVYKEYEAGSGGLTVSRSHLTLLGQDAQLGFVDRQGGVEAVRWAVKDGMMSVAQVADASGRVLDDRLLNAWGQDVVPPIERTGYPYGFSGLRRTPATGHYYARARMYDPAVGRFTSRDPAGLAEGTNPYLYAGNSPVTYRDAGGEFLQFLVGAVVGAGVDLGTQGLMVALGVQDSIDWRSVGASAAMGAVSGGASALIRAVGVGSKVVRALGAVDKVVDVAETAVDAFEFAQFVGDLMAGDPGGEEEVEELSIDPLAGNAPGVSVDMDEVMSGIAEAQGDFVAEEIGKTRPSILHRIDVPDTLCFLAGTLVVAEGGRRPIESLRPGDRVLARDEITAGSGWKEVSQVHRNRAQSVTSVTFAGRTVRSTAEHPWMARGRGWTRAADLRPGDRLIGEAGEDVLVEAVSTVQEAAATFNISVEEHKTYFVAASAEGPAVWVHNRSRRGGGPTTWSRFEQAMNKLFKKDAQAAVREARKQGKSPDQIAKIKKRYQRKLNRILGKAGENSVPAKVKHGKFPGLEDHEVLGVQLNVRSKSGNRRIIDVLLRNKKTGEIIAIEVKNGRGRSYGQERFDGMMAAKGGPANIRLSGEKTMQQIKEMTGRKTLPPVYTLQDLLKDLKSSSDVLDTLVRKPR